MKTYHAIEKVVATSNVVKGFLDKPFAVIFEQRHEN